MRQKPAWKVVAVKNDLGCYKEGAKGAWEAFQKALERYGKRLKADVIVEEDQTIFNTPPMFNQAKYIERAPQLFEMVADAVEGVLAGGNIPLVVTGSHFAGGGSLAGAKAFHEEKRMGVVWIDAHADINSPLTSQTGNLHGMTLSTALGMIHTKHMVPYARGEAREVKRPWFELCDTKGIMPKITPRDLVLIGTRTLDEKELAIITESNIRVYNPKEMRLLGVKRMLQETKEYLKECDVIYVSFDVGAVDPRSVSDATGTPVLDGIHLEEMDEILTGLLDGKLPICGLEIAEINPRLEKPGMNSMAEAVAYLISKHM